MDVQNLLEGSNPYQVFQNQANKLASKWEKSGLLEGKDISTDTDKNNMAVLLENQAKQLVLEANTTGTGASFSAGNSEAWAGVALPLVRRVFGEIVAKDLISVQPMNLPSGLIFYLDFRYGTAQSPFTSGESMYGATSDMTKTDAAALGVGGSGKGLYGAGRFGYSINETSSGVVFAAALAAGKYVSASATYAGILNLDTEFSSSVAGNGSSFGSTNGNGNTIKTIQVQTASLVDFDKEGVRAFTVSGSGGFNTFYPQFTRINGGNVEFVVSASANVDLATFVVTYQKGPDNLDDRGDFEDSLPAGSGAVSTLDIPEVNVQLRSDTVTAKTRKLKAQWTPEFAQDLNAYHSIDAEAELTSILSEYISMEIDLEILDMLIRNADTTAYWSADTAKEISDSGVESTASGVYYTKMSWYQTLGVKLQKVSNLIHQKTLRGGANWMVVSPKVSTIIESIPGFAADSPGDQAKYNMGVQKVGSVNNKYVVYKNPYMTENVILMGYKGSQFLETGAVFAPYIPLIMTPLVYDPASFTPKKGIMTRYAKKMVRPDFYGKVYLKALDLV